ncbi:MAG: SpoIIE family protein phosphatase [Kineosporiaceae bacterium]
MDTASRWVWRRSTTDLGGEMADTDLHADLGVSVTAPPAPLAAPAPPETPPGPSTLTGPSGGPDRVVARSSGASVAALITEGRAGWAVLDDDLNLVDLDPGLTALGTGEPGVPRRRLGDVLPELGARLEPTLRDVVRSGLPLRGLRVRTSRGGTEQHWVVAAVALPAALTPPATPATPVTPAPSRPALAVLIRDITDRVEAEHELSRTAALLDLLILRAPVGIAFLDPQLRYLRINETLAGANGVPVEEHVGRAVADVLPEVAPEVVPLLERVLRTGEPVRDLRLETGPTPGRPGTRRAWTVDYYRVVSGEGSDDPRTEGVGLIVEDDTDRLEAERERHRLRDAEHEAVHRAAAAARAAQQAAREAAEAADRQQLLQRLTAELAPAMTRSGIADVLSSLTGRLLGADVAAVLEYDGAGALHRLVPHGGEESRISAQPLPLARFSPARDAVEQRRPVVWASHDERNARYPDMAWLPVEQEAWATLPLVSGEQVLGVVSLAWAAPREVDAADLALLEALAGQCAIALERLHLYEAAQEARDAAERARARVAVLAGAGEVLGASLDEREILHSLGALLVPTFTDWLMVLLPDRRGRLAPKLSFHADPALAWASQRVLEGEPFGIDAPIPPAQVFRSRRSMLIEDFGAQVRLGHVPAPIAEAALAVGPGPALLVPMVARGRTIGVLSLVDAATRGGDLAAETRLVEDIARRAAMALNNASLFGQRTRVAARLQDSLLPPALPRVPGAVVAARYVVAEEAVEVGGDFYDVVALPGDARLLVIGDVAGRGVDAAGTTGLARYTLRALARDASPAQALTRLNDVLVEQAEAEEAGERFLTAACVRYERDGDGARLRVARAGHPPVLVVAADGTTTFVASEGPLLGVLEPVRIEEVAVRLEPGDSLVLYTDGITEARRGDAWFGQERLGEAAAAAVRRPGFGGPQGADQLAQAVLDAVSAFDAGSSGDDRALLVVHVPAGDQTRNAETS